MTALDSRSSRCFQLCFLRAPPVPKHHALGLLGMVMEPLICEQGVHPFVISQRLTSRKREAVAVLRRSASAVWIHFIIPEAEINREHEHPEQG